MEPFGWAFCFSLESENPTASTKNLSEADQAAVSAFVNQIETIVEIGTEGASDADYWKKIAFRIRVNSPFVLSETETVFEAWCWNEDTPEVYPIVSGNCRQPEHGPIEKVRAAVRVRVYLEDQPLMCKTIVGVIEVGDKEECTMVFDGEIQPNE